MSFNRLKWIYLIGFFLMLALPLLSLPPWFSPPAWGKTIVFRIILSVLVFFFSYQWLKNREKPFIPKKAKAGFYLLLALLGVYFLATIFSLDPNLSLWGLPYRGGGFVNFAFYIIMAILAFFVIRRDDWPKIWNFSILIGALAAILAIFQWQGWLADTFISYSSRPPSSLGNPTMLALYLLLLSFLTLTFGLREKNLPKKVFYFTALFLFVFVISLTYSRAVYLGLIIGLLYFFFFYPLRRRIFSLLIKVSLLTILILGSLAIYYVNVQPELPGFIQGNKTLNGMVNRLSIEKVVQDARISAWKVSWQALKDRPILGYGPENFAVGFDKHYDPSLPQIGRMRKFYTEGWWDRAHNFILDITITAGIPALIVFLSLIFWIFWQLQKIKYIAKEENRTVWLTAHGLQAVFLGYLIAIFFTFDVFSTYLILFLTIGYSLSLIGGWETNPTTEAIKKKTRSSFFGRACPLLILILLGCFIWNFNLKPLHINKEIDLAEQEAEHDYCEQAINRMESVIAQKSFLDAYLRVKYVDILVKCKEQMPEAGFEFVKRGTALMREAVEFQPYHSSNYIVLGSFLNSWIENEEDEKVLQDLKEEAALSFETALNLSPKRQEFFVELVKNNLIIGQYEEGKDNAQKCIDLNENFGACWWFLALSNAYLDQEETAKENIEKAGKLSYPVKSEESLLILAKIYVEKENYPRLKEIYQRLIKIGPNNPGYHASLAIVYKELGEFENARKSIQKTLELAPELKKEVEEFLRQLP